MTEPTTNPYAPPRAAVEESARDAAAAVPARLPVVLVLRWLLSAMLVGVGLWRLMVLAANWRFFTDSMVIAPAYNPVPWLLVELCVPATGVLLALRSRWVFVPLFLHVGLFARQVFSGLAGAGIPGLAYLFWTLELLVFGFCAWLWLQRRLK